MARAPLLRRSSGARWAKPRVIIQLPRGMTEESCSVLATGMWRCFGRMVSQGRGRHDPPPWRLAPAWTPSEQGAELRTPSRYAGPSLQQDARRLMEVAVLTHQAGTGSMVASEASSCSRVSARPQAPQRYRTESVNQEIPNRSTAGPTARQPPTPPPRWHARRNWQAAHPRSAPSTGLLKLPGRGTNAPTPSARDPR